MLKWHASWLPILGKVDLLLFLHLREEISVGIDIGPNFAC